MRRRAVRALAAWFCAASCLIGGGVPPEGYLLCFGLDGHIDIGSIEDGCIDCDAPGPIAAEVAESELGESAACCPCVDVPVVAPGDFNRSASARRFVEHPVALAAAVSPVVVGWEMPGRPHDFRSHPPDARRGVLDQLRTVILLG